MNTQGKHCLIYVLLFLLLVSCERSNIDITPLSSITKPERETVGNYLKLYIYSQVELYPVFQISGKKAEAYWYLQTLYNQVTNKMRLDNNAPDNNKWTEGRTWTVNILDSKGEVAFVIPGGDLFISKNLLKKITSEYQLYYLMAMEATLMNDMHLLKQLVTEYSAQPFIEFSRKPNLDSDWLNPLLSTIQFEPYSVDALFEAHQSALNLICESSIFDPTGLEGLIAEISFSSQWLSSRPLQGFQSLGIANEACGDFRSNGNYRQYVIDNLD